jgi:hypothetical protein
VGTSLPSSSTQVNKFSLQTISSQVACNGHKLEASASARCWNGQPFIPFQRKNIGVVHVQVSDPLAKYFSLHPHIAVTVASDSSRDGQRLASLGDNIDSVVVDVNKEPERLNELIRSASAKTGKMAKSRHRKLIAHSSFQQT